MKHASEQLYSQLREAMFENKLTASDISQKMEVHYTYVYNTIRKNANITLDTAAKLAFAAGYDLQLTLVPRDGSAPLTGTMDPQGPMFSARRKKVEPVVAVEATPAAEPAGVAEPITDDDINALLELGDA